jgi:hypothetical protein
MGEAVVIRNNKIKLSKEIMRKLDLNKGDVIFLEIMDSLILISKRNPNPKNSCD